MAPNGVAYAPASARPKPQPNNTHNFKIKPNCPASLPPTARQAGGGAQQGGVRAGQRPRPTHNLHTNLNLNLNAQQACRPLRARLVVAPNGVAYAPASARPGVIPRLLREILATRVMVKAGMKRAGANARVLQRVLNARQFGLKLIANVTYGYTAAGFSGRMPCAELADSIVQSARETLENAIRMVEAHPGARARIVPALQWMSLLGEADEHQRCCHITGAVSRSTQR